MKKSNTFLVLFWIASLHLMAERVPQETALKVAATFLNNNGAKSAKLTDLSKTAGFANLYIFNAEPGFVVMAADDCVQPILGYSLTGKFVAENMPTNVSGWLQGYSDEIQFAIESKAKPSAETAKLWKDLIDGDSKAAKATTVVDNLLSTTWDQIHPYNALCPRDPSTNQLTVTGCMATAMAQIMKYWDYPVRGKSENFYSTPKYGTLYVNFGESEYDWANMPSFLTNASTQEQIEAVATLMYHCGVAVNMQYDIASNGGSLANSTALDYAYRSYFNYSSSVSLKNKSSYTTASWLNLLKTELDGKRPIHYNGHGDQGGHSFVCCGYDDGNNFYFNWGWSGQNDGFFALNNLVPNSGGGGGYDFTNYQEAIIGIQPKLNNYPPSNLQATLEQGIGIRNVNLSWSAATNANEYMVFRNDKILATVSSGTLTYTDVHVPYGTYGYYVRSMDSDGVFSQPSDTASVTFEFLVNDLNATTDGNDIALSWTPLANDPQSATLQYVGYGSPASIGALSSTTQFWAVRFPASTLANYENLALISVGNWCTFGSDISINVYQCTGSAPTGNAIWTHSFSDTPGTTVGEWREFPFDPILLDPSKDLWIVYASTNAVSGKGPVYMRPFTSSEGDYYSYDGENWNHWSGGNTWTFPIAAGITYGAYTYNLDRNGERIASELTTTSYTDPNRNNAASYYTVTANRFGGESAASNMAGIAMGTTALDSLSIGNNDQMTVAPNSTLTVTGALINDNAKNLILENGAQLLHESEGVKATVKKTIEPYTANVNGWNFIASPVTENLTPSVENGLIANGYDLYYYDEPEHYWRNYASHSDNFIIEHKKGYLYANIAETTLQFEGTLAPSGCPVNTDTLSHSAETLIGFNLVGNPFACNATVDKDCYVISGRRVILAEERPTLAPCEGVMVKADSDQSTVTFTKANGAKGNGKGKSLDLVVTKGGVSTGPTPAILDRARVRLGEGTNMEKFNLNDISGTSLIFCQDGQDYAVAYTNGQSEMPLNFKAAENGTYSIGIEHNNLDLDYLHLIDNMTGADIDLLQQTEYTFTAKTTDYASRFRLVFSNDNAGGDACEPGFAYISNGEIIVNGTGTLQVIDLLGHVLITDEVNSAFRIPHSAFSTGVYVLRLINGHNVRTQKIVIE